MSGGYLAQEKLELRLVECQNCGATYGAPEQLDRQFPDIPDLAARVAPGEIVPVGECTECGALCHFMPPDNGPTAKLATELQGLNKPTVVLTVGDSSRDDIGYRTLGYVTTGVDQDGDQLVILTPSSDAVILGE